MVYLNDVLAGWLMVVAQGCLGPGGLRCGCGVAAGTGRNKGCDPLGQHLVVVAAGCGVIFATEAVWGVVPALQGSLRAERKRWQSYGCAAVGL